jgi:hypothetical protein
MTLDRSDISTVQLSCEAFGATRRSCPVTSVHGTPSLFIFSEISHASNLNGAQYTPLPARFNRCIAAYVFPLFVGPTCSVISRRIDLASGYAAAGSRMSNNR